MAAAAAAIIPALISTVATVLTAKKNKAPSPGKQPTAPVLDELAQRRAQKAELGRRRGFASTVLTKDESKLG